MNKKYIQKGKCIWCGKTEEEGASFVNRPHVIPLKLGGNQIGVDVCDECNHYFGTCTKDERVSVDMAFKEVLQLSKLSLSTRGTSKNYSSKFFYINVDEKLIKPKGFGFPLKSFTIPFKRGLCECFLQKYHSVTYRGNEKRFDMLRNFARYGVGNIPVYYTFNKVIFTTGTELPPDFIMDEVSVETVDNYGFYVLHLYGHIFTIDVIPSLDDEKKKSFFSNPNNMMITKGITEKFFLLEDLNQIDLLYSRFDGFQHWMDQKGNIVLPDFKSVHDKPLIQ